MSGCGSTHSEESLQSPAPPIDTGRGADCVRNLDELSPPAYCRKLSVTSPTGRAEEGPVADYTGPVARGRTLRGVFEGGSVPSSARFTQGAVSPRLMWPSQEATVLNPSARSAITRRKMPKSIFFPRWSFRLQDSLTTSSHLRSAICNGGVRSPEDRRMVGTDRLLCFVLMNDA